MHACGSVHWIIRGVLEIIKPLRREFALRALFADSRGIWRARVSASRLFLDSVGRKDIRSRCCSKMSCPSTSSSWSCTLLRQAASHATALLRVRFAHERHFLRSDPPVLIPVPEITQALLHVLSVAQNRGIAAPGERGGLHGGDRGLELTAGRGKIPLRGRPRPFESVARGPTTHVASDEG